MRHGESTWNREHRIQGQLDPPLSDLGRKQAELLARRLGSWRPEAIYASDLKRAMETATPIGVATGVAVQPLAELREIALGAWEGLTTAQLAEQFPAEWARWTAEPDWDVVPGGEGPAAFEERVGSALDALMTRHPHGEIVVVTHGGVIQLAIHRIIGQSSRGLFPFRLSNASITLNDKRDGRVVIAGVNDIGHLADGAGPAVGPG